MTTKIPLTQTITPMVKQNHAITASGLKAKPSLKNVPLTSLNQALTSVRKQLGISVGRGRTTTKKTTAKVKTTKATAARTGRKPAKKGAKKA